MRALGLLGMVAFALASATVGVRRLLLARCNRAPRGGTALDGRAARGTVRLARDAAGLDPGSVTTRQRLVVLKSVLPGELRKRGVEDPDAVCQRLGEALASAGLSSDAAEGAAAIFARLGNG